MKDAAKYVCPSNEEDGVLVTLENYLHSQYKAKFSIHPFPRMGSHCIIGPVIHWEGDVCQS